MTNKTALNFQSPQWLIDFIINFSKGDCETCPIEKFCTAKPPEDNLNDCLSILNDWLNSENKEF